jgi:hypothetical protein
MKLTGLARQISSACFSLRGYCKYVTQSNGLPNQMVWDPGYQAYDSNPSMKHPILVSGFPSLFLVRNHSRIYQSMAAISKTPFPATYPRRNVPDPGRAAAHSHPSPAGQRDREGSAEQKCARNNN